MKLTFSTWLLFVIGLITTPALAASLEPTRISLPKGPGSIEGLGSEFEPSIASGTAAYSVPIAVPPAVAGFGPSLSLSYDAGDGVSTLGLGWKLSGVASIRRRTEQGLPHFDETDAFELTGLGVPCDLLPMGDGVFRPEHETGSFVRVRRSLDGQSWEARVKSGVTYRFGGDGFVEQESGRVVTYLLREQVDLHGHVIRYHWDVENGQARLTRVSWNESSDATTNEVRFTYEARPDTHERFSSGIRQVLAHRVANIEVLHGGALVRRYDLAYADASISRLEQVRMVGSDGVTALPALTLEYAEPTFASEGQVIAMQSPPGRSPAEGNVSLADLNGDGLPDLLVAEAGQYRSYNNHDGNRWEPGKDWAASPSVSLSSPGVQLADVDGDGAIDLLVKSGVSDFRYFPGRDGTSFADSVPLATVLNITFEDPDVRLADMDGDRRVDVVVTTTAGLAIGYNEEGKDWSEPELVGVVDPQQPLRFSDGRTSLCDMNGDRLQDLCYLRSGSLTFWLGRGRGVFEPAREATGVPSWDDSDPWLIADLNGDGWADLVRVGITVVQAALASGTGVFDVPSSIEGVPHRKASTNVQLSDLNGSGTTDIVWIDPSASPDEAWRMLELFPKGRGGLLTKIDNGLGKVVTITYEPAAKHAARAREAGSPWSTRMNVAMPVVRKVEVDASLGDPVMTTEITYRDGTWDPDSRTFAGFGSGVQRQLGDEYTPTLVTETRFDTGLQVRALRGAVVWSEQRADTGHVFQRTESQHAVKVLDGSTDGRSVVHAYLASQRVEHVEGDEAGKRVTLTEWGQDRYGNVVKEWRWGEVVGDDKLVGNDEAITVRTFANDEQEWVLGYLASEELMSAGGERVWLTRQYYDGEAFVGLGLGQVVRGDVTRVEEWVEADRFVNAKRSEYDEHGNEVVLLNAADGRTELTYHESKVFVEKEVSSRQPCAQGVGAV